MLVALFSVAKVYQQEKCLQHHAGVCDCYEEVRDKGAQKD
jgi:hypothetical protein